MLHYSETYKSERNFFSSDEPTWDGGVLGPKVFHVWQGVIYNCQFFMQTPEKTHTEINFVSNHHVSSSQNQDKQKKNEENHT
jgi:hypothetical protein